MLLKWLECLNEKCRAGQGDQTSFLAQGLIQSGSGPNRLPTSPSPTHARCSTAGRRVAHAAEHAIHCWRASHLSATRRLAPCSSITSARASTLLPLTRAAASRFDGRSAPSCGHGRHCRAAKLLRRCCSSTSEPSPNLPSAPPPSPSFAAPPTPLFLSPRPS
jgi:hypothetical protein